MERRKIQNYLLIALLLAAVLYLASYSIGRTQSKSYVLKNAKSAQLLYVYDEASSRGIKINSKSDSMQIRLPKKLSIITLIFANHNAYTVKLGSNGDPIDAVKTLDLITEAKKRPDPELVKQYPVLKDVPVYKQHFYITYSLPDQPGDKLGITITVFATNTEENLYLNDVRAYRQEGLNYLTSKGYKLDDFNLTYGEPDLLSEFPQGIKAQDAPNSSNYTGDGVPPEQQ